MGMVIGGLIGLHNAVFGAVQSLLQDWFLGLTARVWFAVTLLFFFWGGAMRKLGDNGLVDLDAAAAQILGEAFFIDYGGDSSQLGFDFLLVAYSGTIAEFVLPALIVLGLFTRVAAVGMIVFIAVLSYVDINFHNITFDAGLLVNGRPENVTPPFANAVLMEGRIMWIFPLLYLAIRGAGMVSLDWLFGRIRA